MKILLTLFFLTVLAFNLMAQSKLQIKLVHQVDSQELNIPSPSYSNNFNQDFILTKFKYYVGNVELHSEKDTIQLDKYFLIDDIDSLSKIIEVKLKKNTTYNQLQFTLGVDSIDNCSGVQSGALDPMNGMFWSWNTGYIFFKLEGRSKFSSAPGKFLEYHIGGFKEPINCIRTISLPIEVCESGELFVIADISRFLSYPTPISFEELPVVMDVLNAETIADNYQQMFSIKEFIPDEK